MSVENQTILVIDDDSGVRMLLDKFLSKEGYKVVLATSGHDGLILSNHEKMDVVLLDLSLGDMTGVEIAKAIRARYGHSLKIIGITAYSHDTIKMYYPEAFDVFNDFCFKPFSHRDLIELIKKT